MKDLRRWDDLWLGRLQDRIPQRVPDGRAAGQVGSQRQPLVFVHHDTEGP